MTSEIIEIINDMMNKYDKSEVLVDNKDYCIIKKNKRYYCLVNAMYDNVQKICLEASWKNVEDICMEDEEFKKIPSQLRYCIIFAKYDELGEQTYKDVIKIEENEYFCKKYVMYYMKKEVESFEKWKKKNRFATIDEVLAFENNSEILKKVGDDTEPLKFFLRILIKCPFLRYTLKDAKVGSVDGEFVKINEKIRDKEQAKKSALLKIEIENILENINNEDFDTVVNDYIMKLEAK